MAYISNVLTHWVGREFKNDDQKRYEILTKNILKEKELLFGLCRLSSLSNYLKRDINAEMICFTDIPLSECESHCEEYSRFGISFKKEYLANLYAAPVAYSLHPAFAGNFYYVYKTLDKLNEILKEKTETEFFDFNANEKDHTISKNTKPLLLNMFAYHEEYDEKKLFPYSPQKKVTDRELFFKNKKAKYFEREWRIIPSSLSSQNHSVSSPI
jgi:hypothetical protein